MYVSIQFSAYETIPQLLDLIGPGLGRVAQDLEFLADNPAPEEGINYRKITVNELGIRCGRYNYKVEDFVDIADVIMSILPKKTDCYTFGIIDKMKKKVKERE
nr:hypothetical protein [Nanoarchaeum sp.]